MAFEETFFQLVSDKAGTRIQIFLCFLSSQKNHRDNREKISGTLKALASATFVLDYGEYVGFPGGSDGTVFVGRWSEASKHGLLPASLF